MDYKNGLTNARVVTGKTFVENKGDSCLVDVSRNLPYYIPMIGFLLRKTLYDLWDNMLRILLVNVGFLVSLAMPLFLPALVPPGLGIPLLVLGLLWCSVYLCAAAGAFRAVSDYGSFGFADFLAGIRPALVPGICLGGIAGLLALVFYLSIPFYSGLVPPLGPVLAAVTFWAAILAVLCLQFFPQVKARLGGRTAKAFGKCLFLFFDNPGLAVFCLISGILGLAFSFLLALLLPGPAGIILFLDEALRLRLLKYDWLEANPEKAAAGKRPRIPWDEILAGEREKTGRRSFRNFIFPWKD